MKSTQLCLPICFLLILLPFAVGAQDDAIRESRRLAQLAQRAYQEKNYAACVEHLEGAVVLRPTHPTFLYNLAGAYALTGKNEAALKMLGRVAAMGMIYPAEKDADFASIAKTEEFGRILKRFEANRAPGGRSERALTFAGKGLVTESVAVDESSGDTFVSSVYERKIVRLDRKGTVTDFATSASGLWSVLGIRIDARRGVLWAASSAQAQMRDGKTEERGRAGLFRFDLKTGKLLGKYLLENASPPHVLGDLVIGAGGEVYATDSVTPALYRLAPGGDRLEAIIEGRPLVSPQGLDFAPGGERLFIADYSQGVFVLDLKTRQLEPLKIPGDCTLLGTDGLYFHRRSLIAIQNGVNPHRVVRLHLNQKLDQVERWEVLEANHPDFDEPTLGVVVRNEFLYVANSQWGAVDQQGKLAPVEKLRDPVILRLRL